MASKRAVQVLSKRTSTINIPGMWAHPNHGSVAGTLACRVCGGTLAAQLDTLKALCARPGALERRIAERERTR